MQKSLTTLLKRLWINISGRRRVQFVMLLILTILSSIAEVLSIGAVLPFIGVLTQPEVILSSRFLSDILKIFSITSEADLIIFLTIAFALAAIMAGVLRLLLLWFSIYLGNTIGADLSTEVYRRTLYQSYSVHIARSSSEIISGITQKVGTATSILISIVTVITSSGLFFAILIALVIADPVIAFLSFLSFGAAYGVIAWFSRKRLVNNSVCIAREQIRVVKALQEGLGGIRDILLNGTQKIYCNVYRGAIFNLQRASGENTFINQAPRYAMEALGMVLIAIFVLALSYRSGGIAAALPILAMLVLGAQRLLPLMQQLYGNWSVVLGSKAALIDVLALLEQPLPKQASLSEPEPLLLKQSIQFENVGFRYENNSQLILDGMDLTIYKGTRVGIIGSTGSGKSTALDLLMGLLQPTKGRIIIDGHALDQNNQRAWQRSVAHVPQSIFLSDSSIAENIAFGVPLKEIDMDRVRMVAQQSRIADFIETRPEGYNTFVGERGVRLSGGQRQRIGIARALYRQASVLIFDEATSALDSETEKAVIQAIEGLSKNLTIFMIAHRLTTLRSCDVIIKIDAGKVLSMGSFESIFNAKELVK